MIWFVLERLLEAALVCGGCLLVFWLGRIVERGGRLLEEDERKEKRFSDGDGI